MPKNTRLHRKAHTLIRKITHTHKKTPAKKNTDGLTQYNITVSICSSVGQPIAVLSAMKMEMVVNAPVGGVVKAIRANKGDKLEGQDLLMEIE